MTSTTLSMLIMGTILLFDFNTETNVSNWNVVDDNVMGGISGSVFTVKSNGNGVFKGTVSVENNGGFCSVQHQMEPKSINGSTTFLIRLKGDGKKYQFRVKSKRTDYYSYVFEFQTTLDWETIEIPIAQMQASFRGRKVDIPNYDGMVIEEMAFLISNKKAENFELELDKIEVK